MKNKEMITCDIDGVLTDYPLCWLKYLQEKCGTLYSSTEEAKLHEKDYSLYKDMYRESDYKATLPMNENNRIALNKLAETYDIIFTTSRPIDNPKYPHLRENTYNWLSNNGLKFKELRFKDINAEFLNDLEIAFHIDDEVKYANSVAEKISNNQYNSCRGGVYLLTGNLKPKGLHKDVKIVKDIQEITESPFFSVCIPSTNRGKTIYRALKAVAEQTYRNFELIIVDCQSKDNTVSEIERFFASEDYKNNSFTYTFEKREYTPVGTEDWNEPLKLAKGKYIAMLEGDDYWLPEHLMTAYAALSANPNVGIYGASNLESRRYFQGLLPNKAAKILCYKMKYGVVPPSESIFIRLSKDGKPFLYNSEDYKYSPEIGLYVDITLNGYDLFYSQIQDVYREPNTNPDSMKTWYYFADRFLLINKYNKEYSKNIVFNAKLSNAFVVMTFAVYSRSRKKALALINNLSKTVGKFITTVTFVRGVIFALQLIFRKIIRKIIKK